MTFLQVSCLAPVYFISDRSQQFQTEVLLLQGWMLVSVKTKKHLDLDQVERDFCSARQAYGHPQQEEVTDERDLRPNFQEASWVWSLPGGNCYRKHTDWNRPPWPGTIATICMSCFMTGGPSKEHGTNKPPPTRRAQERTKGDITCLTTPQNPSLWHPSWLNRACTTRKDSESEWLAKDNLETNPITIKPETASHVTELFSWVPLPATLHPDALSQ